MLKTLAITSVARNTSRMVKIGFDFDGVIAYNPLRVLRLPLNFASGFLFRKKIVNYYPSNRLSQLLWKAAHKFSLFPAKGFAELKLLMREGKIEGYLISGRYALLEDDLRFWLSKHEADKLFKGCYVNSADDPPHKFKEKMIRKLKLDYFVEDNWDIVNYLNSSLGSSGSTPNHSFRSGTGHGFKVQGSKLNSKSQMQNNLEPAEGNCQIHWIYNILDRHIPYSNKHPHLKNFLEHLQREARARGI